MTTAVARYSTQSKLREFSSTFGMRIVILIFQVCLFAFCISALFVVALPATLSGILAISGGDVQPGLKNLANAITIYVAIGALIWWFSKDPASISNRFGLRRLLLVLTIVSLVLAMVVIVLNNSTFLAL
jgi:hypothetical protein